MAWPGVSDYQAAIQAPQICFDDLDLKTGSPVLTKLGLPRPISGGNASVYQIRSGKNEYAVRCFLRDIPDLRQRYAAIDQHLRQSRLHSKVGFDFLQEGIRIRGQWFPILKMMWVRGVPLNDYVETIVDDKTALGRLLDDWTALLANLEQERMAHGDLQHGNVLVAKDKLLLIDYDGMYVPALKGNPSYELGHPSYQHPRRQQDDFGPEIDRFSALVVHVALRALRRSPALWQQYSNSDNMLFTRDDFADPQQSPLFAELERLGDADLAAAARALRLACNEPVDRVPKIQDAVRIGQAAAGRLAPPVAPPVSAPVSAAPAAAPAPASNGAHAPAAKSRPQWLADLMGPAPTPAANGASVAFSLGQVWKRSVPSSATAVVPTPLSSPHRLQRTLVWLLLFCCVQLVTWATKPQLLWPTTVGWVVAALLLRRRRLAAAGTGPRGVGTSRTPLVRALTLSLDGRSLATAGEGRYAYVLETATGKSIRRLGPHELTVTAVAAAGKDQFATGARDGCIRVFDDGGRVHRSWRDSRCHAATATADGQLLAFAVGNGLIKVWSSDGQAQGTLRGHKSEVQALAFTRDKKRLVSGSGDNTVRVWMLASRSCEHVLCGHDDSVEAIAVSADGQLTASGGRDGRICIWDTNRARLVHAIEPRAGAIRALAFTPDGGSLLAGGADRSIHCIDPGTGKLIGKVAGHTAAITALAVSSDGSRVVSADAGGTLAVWQRRSRSQPLAATPTAPAVLQAARP